MLKAITTLLRIGNNKNYCNVRLQRLLKDEKTFLSTARVRKATKFLILFECVPFFNCRIDLRRLQHFVKFQIVISQFQDSYRFFLKFTHLYRFSRRWKSSSSRITSPIFFTNYLPVEFESDVRQICSYDIFQWGGSLLGNFLLEITQILTSFLLDSSCLNSQSVEK